MTERSPDEGVGGRAAVRHLGWGGDGMGEVKPHELQRRCMNCSDSALIPSCQSEATRA